MDYPWTLWASFFLFWAIEMAIIWRGMDTLRRFENWAAPFVIVVAVALLIWVLVKAGGLGPILSQPSKLGWGADFWKLFAPSLMGMIAFWATLSLNIPDFTRFGGGQRQQALGQVLGLPTTMSFFAILSIMITSGTAVIYGEAIWDPIQLAAKFDNPAGRRARPGHRRGRDDVGERRGQHGQPGVRLLQRRAPAGQLPYRRPDHRRARHPDPAVAAGAGPATSTSSSGSGSTAVCSAPVAGVLIAGYWVRGRTDLQLAGLYRPEGRYWFTGGWNWAAVVATVVGAVLAVGGAYSAPGKGPFPTDGLIPFLKPLYDYSWVVGLVGAFVDLPGAVDAAAPAATRREENR